MSDMIRSSNAGRFALAWIVLFGSLALSQSGQEAPKQDTPQAVPGQTTKDDPPAKTVTVPPQDAPVPTAPATQTPPATGGQTTGTVTAPAPGASDAKSKKGKSAGPSGPGQVTSRGVQEKTYEIGPEDVLYINVLHQPDVSGTLEVRPDGFVSVRFAGEVKAAGMTAQKLSDVVAEKLTVYFNHPEVIVQVVKINSKKYYIAGEVHRPGAYPLTSSKTIYEALIEAGGLAEFAKGTKIYILRGQNRIPFNFKDVSKGKNLKQNILLENGDVIQVP